MGNDRPELQAGFQLVVSDDDKDVAYLYLPTHPRSDSAGAFKTKRLRDVIGSYEGPDVILDFDATGTLVGIEVLA